MINKDIHQIDLITGKTFLDSWKEISDYLERSEKTCRKWEKELGLPIHRLEDSPKARVFAYREELDRWMREKLSVIGNDNSEKTVVLKFQKFFTKKSIIIISVVLSLMFIALANSDIFFKKKNGIKNVPQQFSTIAVFPLENINREEGYEYFASGMHDSLITELSKIRALKVISRSTVIRLKDTGMKISKLSKDFNIEFVVKGSVLLAGHKVRITAQLIRTEPEQNIWTEDYVRDLKDVLTLQKEVASAIVHKIKIKLSPEEETYLKISKLVNPKAHELYLRGRFLIDTEYTQKSIQQSIKFFQKSLEIDAGCALAYTGLADAYSLLGNYGFLQPYEAFPKAKEYSIKALEIDETLAEAHAQLGLIKMNWDWDWTGAEKAYKRAIELNPGYSLVYFFYAGYLTAIGQFDKSIETMKKSVELDPLSITTNCFLGVNLYFARRYDEAILILQKNLEIDHDHADTLWFLGLAYEQKKMYQEAITEFKRSIRFSKDMTANIASLGHAYALSGKRSEALKILDNLLELSGQKYVSSYEIAVVYTGLGEQDQALTWFDKAFKQRDGWLAFWIKADPRLDSLHSDPRFISILKKMGLE